MHDRRILVLITGIRRNQHITRIHANATRYMYYIGYQCRSASHTKLR